MKDMQPATIKLFLVHGKPTGLRTAEISNWTGKAFAAPRSEIKAFLQRPELDSPGIYFLTGIDPDSNSDVLYIGEAECVRKRIPNHTGKDFWVSAAAFVSKDENLTKAHIRYLENSLIERAYELKIKLLNVVNSAGARLPESDAAEMDVFLDKVLQLLPVLGVSHFNKTTFSDQDNLQNTLFCRIKELVASGRRTEQGFMVYKGSQAVVSTRPSSLTSLQSKRLELLDANIIVEREGYLEFLEDFEFSSPSMAATVIQGGNSNGLRVWKNSNGESLKKLEGMV